MKSKKWLYIGLVGLIAGIFTACEPKEEPIAYWYPQKHIVEEFVSQYCGYCPGGMQAAHDFAKDDDRFITIAHHYGFYTDLFSVKGGDSICNSLGVSGTPSASIDRTKTTYYNRQAGVVFNPTYLPYTKKDQFDDRTYAAVDIETSYDASAHRVKINVKGRVSPNENPNLRLTVLIKESGMVNWQYDYSITSHRWSSYRHTDAVRVFLTAPKGDKVTISENRFFASYNYVLDDSWVPENCMVVAFISEGFQPIINANQQPVVKGSKGGAQYAPEGLGL